MPKARRWNRVGNDDHVQLNASSASIACPSTSADVEHVTAHEISWSDLNYLLQELPEMQRKAAQSLLGLAIGDAAGLPFEFNCRTREQVDALCNCYRTAPGPQTLARLDDLIHTKIEHRTSGKPEGTPFCRAYSDDTTCADLKMQAVAKIASLGNGYSRSELFRRMMEEYVHWAYDDCGNCSKLFQGAGRFTRSLMWPPRRRCPKVVADGVPSNDYFDYAERYVAGHLPGTFPSWGNGAVMSLAPQAILMAGAGLPGIPQELVAIADVLSSSHQHHSAVIGARLLSELLCQIYTGKVLRPADLLSACIHSGVWNELEVMVEQGADRHLYPVKELRDTAVRGDCSVEDGSAFLHQLTGQRDLLKGECFGRFGELLRVASNYGEIAHIYVADTNEPVRFSQRGLNSVIIAIWCVSGSSSVMELLQRILYVGGDTDTIGAVAGQLAGPLLPMEDVCQKFQRFVGLQDMQSSDGDHRAVALASAKRFFYRSLLFASYEWTKAVLQPPLSEPSYTGLTSADGEHLLTHPVQGAGCSARDCGRGRGHGHKRGRGR